MNTPALLVVSSPPLIAFNPYDWYWYVAGVQTKAYSSKLGDYALSSDQTFKDWQTRIGNVPSNIDSEASIGDLLVPYVPNITLTSTVLVIQQAIRQRQLDILLEGDKADTVKMVQGGQSTTTSGTAVANYLSASTNNYRSLRNQIANATTAAAVRAININAGWPNNP